MISCKLLPLHMMPYYSCPIWLVFVLCTQNYFSEQTEKQILSKYINRLRQRCQITIGGVKVSFIFVGPPPRESLGNYYLPAKWQNLFSVITLYQQLHKIATKTQYTVLPQKEIPEEGG